jgi:hypothetical protein
MIEFYYVKQDGKQRQVPGMYWFDSHGADDINFPFWEDYQDFGLFLFEVFVDGKLVFHNALTKMNNLRETTDEDDLRDAWWKESLYGIVMKRIHDIMDAVPGSQEENELVKLAEWAEEYEKKSWPFGRIDAVKD